MATFSLSNPHAWNDSGRPDISNFDHSERLDPIALNPLWIHDPIDTGFSWNDLMELIEKPEDRAFVASCCDWDNCQPEMDNPTEYDMLHLASDISSAIGL